MGKWEMVRISELCSLITDGTHQTPTYSEDGYIFLSSKNVTTGKIDWEEIKYIPQELHDQLYKRLAPQKDDLLLAKNGTTGICAKVDRDVIFDIYVSLALLRPKPIIEPNYFVYAINNPYTKRKFNRHLKGIGVPNLHLSSIKETSVPLPPLDEQKRIAKNLDLASEIVKGYKEQLAERDKLVQSVFYEMFGDPVTNEKGWDIRALKNIAIGTLSYGSGASAVVFDGTVRYLRITDINENGQLKNDVVSPSEYDCKYVLHDGDILFARSGATVGKTFRYSNKYGECLYAGYLIRLVPDTTLVLPDYVFSFTKSQYYRRFIEKNMKVVAQPNINAQQYGDLNICVPPLPLQTRFASIVTEIEAQKSQVQQALTEAENLFNSLMQEIF